MATELERAYAAGLFDGEGSVSITRINQIKPRRPRPYAVLHITVTNTDLAVLQWLKERWGGNVYVKRRNPKWRVCGMWYASARRAGMFLADILPYARIKKGQVENGLAYQATKMPGRNGGLTAADWREIEVFMDRARALNAGVER